MSRKKKLSFTAFSVIYAMANGHRYGFDIMEATGLPSGTVYPVLSRLERDGLVYSSWEDQTMAASERRPARRYYQISGEGSRALRDAVETLRGIGGDGVVLPGLGSRL